MNLTTSQKDNIYDFLSENKKKFIYKKSNIDKIESLNLILSNFDIKFETLSDCFEFLTEHWNKKCKNLNCKNNRKIGSLFPNRNDFLNVKKVYGVYKFCDDPFCNYSFISERQKGDNNTCHRMTEESFKSMCKKLSNIMKRKIKNGEFLPNITNSWAKSRCEVEVVRNNKIVRVKTRSSWDAYFQIFNPDFIYEKIVIPYKHNGIEHNYIVDFVDLKNKILFEIKPDSTAKDPKNISKFKYAKKWCRSNGYKYMIIKNKWFRENYNSKLLIKQPSEEKIKLNLRQFDEDKKYKKDKLCR